MAQRYRIRLQCRRHRRPGFNPWIRKMSWRRKCQPTPVFLPRKSHGLRSLVGYSAWVAKSWTWLSTTFFFCLLPWSEVAQSRPTLCDPMDCGLPGSSVHGIFQARMLEWVAIYFSRGASWPRDQTWVSRMVDRCFTVWATREASFTLDKTYF